LKAQTAETKLINTEKLMKDLKEKGDNEINSIKDQNESISNKLISLNKECNDYKKK